MPRSKISKSGGRLQISYELSERVYNSRLYPLRSSNGSDIFLSGTDYGLRVTWSGGNPLYFVSDSEGPLTNGPNHHGDTDAQIAEDAESDDEALYESDEEELDDEQPYSSIVQDLEIALGGPALKIGVPEGAVGTSATANDIPHLLTQTIVVAIALADGSISLVTLPLDPPSAATKRKQRLGARIHKLSEPTPGKVLRDIALTWVSSDVIGPQEQANHDVGRSPSRQTRSRTRSQAVEDFEESEHHLLVGAASSELSGTLELYAIAMPSHGNRLRLSDRRVTPLQKHFLAALATRVAVTAPTSPNGSSPLILLSDISGAIHAFDPFPTEDADAPTKSGHGRIISTFHAAFQTTQESSRAHPNLAYRKKILDAQWSSDGKTIIALLEDGEWGIWETHGSTKQSKSPIDFTVRGFIGDAPETSSSTTSKSAARSRLAPMTPNTRRTRQEDLFAGPKPQPGAPSRGGISVSSSTNNNSGGVDDSIVLWFNASIYRIPSLRNLLSRSSSSNSSSSALGRDAGGSGSLYGPALSRVEGIDLNGEVINNIVQLPPRQKSGHAAAFGNLSVQRDLLVTSEHRLIIYASARQQGGARQLFGRQDDGDDEPESPTAVRDQMLLGSGELDVGGLDRMLDSMTGLEMTGLPKRVGFVAY